MPPKRGAAKAAQPTDDPLARAYELLRELEEDIAADEEVDGGGDGAADDPDQDLVLAAYFGDVDRAKAALAAGASPDARQTGTDQPALWHAVARDHAAIVKLLLDAGADPLIDVEGHDPLTRAEVEGKTELARLLAAKAGKRRRPVVEPTLHEAVMAGDLATTRRLLAAGANPNRTEYKQHILERLWGLDEAERAPFLKLLLDHGLDANAKLWGEPVLFEALRLGRLDLVKPLLAAGADANKRSTYRQATFEQLYPIDTPEKRKLVGLLLDHGLDVRKLAASGPPLTLQLLHDGEVALLKRCLELGADPDLKYNGFTLRQEAEWVTDAAKKAQFARLFAAYPPKKRPR